MRDQSVPSQEMWLLCRLHAFIPSSGGRSSVLASFTGKLHLTWVSAPLPTASSSAANCWEQIRHQVYCGKHSQNILFGHSVTGPVLHSPKLETLGNAQWDQILPFWTQTLVNTEGHRRNLSRKHDQYCYSLKLLNFRGFMKQLETMFLSSSELKGLLI